MIVLGIDISSVLTGWAVINDGTLGDYGRVDVKQYKHPAANNQTLFMFGNDIKQLISDSTPDYIAVENIYGGPNTKTVVLLSMMSGIARYFGYSYTGEEVLNIMPSQVNSLVGIPSRGVQRKERKSAIIKGINQQFELELTPTQDDIADAIGIAIVAYRLLNSKATPRYI